MVFWEKLKLGLWVTFALALTAASFAIDLLRWHEVANPQSQVASSLGYASGPYIIAFVCMAWKKYRNPASFFKIVALLSGLLFLSGLGNIAAPPSV
jgi:hypothetical protein